MEISVSVGGAQQLKRNLFDHSRIFVAGSINNEELFRTTDAPPSDTPSWGAESTISVWNAGASLLIEVLEEPHLFSKRTSLGSVTISVQEILDNKTIAPKDYPLSIQGTINLGFTLTKSLPQKSRIGIIGGGVSGASSAYWLKQFFTSLNKEVEITVFEKDGEVGGRVGNFTLAGETLEKGGTVLMDTGVAYFKTFIEEFKLETIPPFDITAPMGIWDGKEFTIRQPHSILVFLIELLVSYGIISLPRLLELNKRYVKYYNSIYPYLDSHKTFDTGYALLDEVKLGELTKITMRSFCDEKGITGRLYDELLAGSCRANNGLGPNVLMAYVGILSITLDSRSIYSVKGGNVQVIQKLFEASGATVKLNSPVDAVTKNANGTFTIQSGANSQEFDSIMVASQLSFANKIKWEGVTLPPAFTAEREYQTIYEAWAVCELNDEYFKVKEIPGSILTTDNSATPFASIMPIRKLANGKYIFKATSTTPLTDEVLKTIWKNIDETFIHTWSPAFPAALPMQENHWPPYKVDDRIYLSNVLEAAFSNIESSIMSSKNASSLLVKGLLQ